jgi:eukaryotic-like serine/threonine-protein kinase
MACPRCGNNASTSDGLCAACSAGSAALSPSAAAVVGPTGAHAGGVPADRDMTVMGPGVTTFPAGSTPFPAGPTPLPPPVTENAPPSFGGPFAPGHAFGKRYRIIKLLGSGGMGAVYQAWDEELGLVVALKVIRPDITSDPVSGPEVERRFKRELVLARQVTHKHVIRIHDLGEIEGVRYITMQYVHGQNLAAVMRQRGKLPMIDALRIARQVAAGLVAAHEVGVVHRDLKPANIMLGDEDHAYIVDFGIARSAAASATVGMVVGTVEYMPPEQAKGQPSDARSDIYSFGLILLDMVTESRRITSAPSAMVELMDRMQQAPRVTAIEPGLPDGLERIISTATQPDPALRYASASEMADDLDRLEADGRMTAPLPSGRTLGLRGIRARSRRAGIWVAVAVASVFIAGVATAVRSGVWKRSASGSGSVAAAVTLVVLPFRNATGDAALDWLGDSLTEMVTEEVAHAAGFRVISSERVSRLLSDLRVGQQALDQPTIERVSDLTNAKMVVSGKYIKVGGTALRVEATLHDAVRGADAQVAVQAADQNAISDVAQQLANAVFKRSTSDERRTLASLAPSSRSPQAIREYNIGLQLARDARFAEALKHFGAATASDGHFALAFSKAAEMQANLGHDTDAQQLSQSAVDLATNLPERERHLIQARHARLVNDNARAVDAYKRAVTAAPNDTTVQLELGSLYEVTGSLDEARTQLEQVLAVDPKNLDALVSMGRVEIKRKNPQGALDPLNRALSLAIQFENEEARANIVNAIGIAYKRLNRLDDALQYYEQSITIKRRLDQKAGIAATLSEIAQVKERLGKSDEALQRYQEALVIRRQLGDKRGTANSLIDLGSLLDERGKYDEALNLYREALQIERDVGDRNYEALCLNNIGGAYLSKGLHAEALTYFERALEIRESLKAPADIAQTLHNIGEASVRQGQYDRALKSFVRALELRRTTGDKRLMAIDSYSIGTIFDYQGRFGAALKAKQEALTVLRELHDRSFWLAEILNGCGATLGQLGRGDEARPLLTEALALARGLNNGALVSGALNTQGLVDTYRDDWRSAGAAFAEALNEATRAGAQVEMLKAEINLAKTDLAEGRAPKAAAKLAILVEKAQKAGLGYESLDASISLEEARLASGGRTRGEVEAATRRSQDAGLLPLLARSHYVLGSALAASGLAKDAALHYDQSVAVLTQIAEESGNPTLVLKRGDFEAMRRKAAERR